MSNRLCVDVWPDDPDKVTGEGLTAADITWSVATIDVGGLADSARVRFFIRDPKVAQAFIDAGMAALEHIQVAKHAESVRMGEVES